MEAGAPIRGAESSKTGEKKKWDKLEEKNDDEMKSHVPRDTQQIWKDELNFEASFWPPYLPRIKKVDDLTSEGLTSHHKGIQPTERVRLQVEKG